MTKQRKGFSLLELLVVIAILAILLTISFSALNRFRAATEIQQAKQLIAREFDRARSDAYRLGVDQKITWTNDSLSIEGNEKRIVDLSASNRVSIEETGSYSYSAPYGTTKATPTTLNIVLGGKVRGSILIFGVRGKVYTN